MLIPVRCFTCGNPVSEDYDKYVIKTAQDKIEPAQALNELEFSRFCCRRMFLGHVPLIDEIKDYHRH